MFIHTEEKPYTCKTCGKGFVWASLLKLHEFKHTGNKPYACRICGTRFTIAAYLEQHVKNYSVEVPDTEDSNGKPLIKATCLERGKSIRTSGLKRPTLSHEEGEPYKCNKCSKSFFHRTNWKRHMLMHAGVKPYICDTCGKRFIDNGALKKHVSVHTGDKPYEPRHEIFNKCYVRPAKTQSSLRIHPV